MPYRASHRFARISPTKVRPVARLIRGRYADEALEALRYMPKRGARMLEKVLRSALGNAEDQGVRRVENLVIMEARVDNGPMFKRLQPRARGMAFLVRHRYSHIHVVVEEAEVLLERS
jgi:large subunit ribosomal protein L22